MREKITIKFKGNTDDIIMVSDSISTYDTTAGTTIIQASGYATREISTDIIKSISLEYMQDKTTDKTKDTEETLDKMNEILRTVDNIWACLSDITDECRDLMDDITAVINEIEVM